MSNEKDGPRCTVGDNFTGFKKIAHDLMMNNELYAGYGAYKLSYANTQDPDNKSGLSFGGNQMDMSKRPDAVTAFVDILKNAKDNKGNLIIKGYELDSILGRKNVNLTKTLQSPEQVFGKNLPLVNAALSSEYGIKKIDAAYVADLNHDVAHIDKAISLIKNPAAKAFYDNDAGRTWLYDYHNQYGLILGGKDAKFINDYINGDYNGTKRTDCSTKQKYSAPTDHYSLEDHIKYLHSTEQFSKTPEMVDKRIKKTFTLLESYGLNGISVVKKTGPESVESYAITDESSQSYTEDGMWIITTKPGYHINHDPIMANIANQPIENFEPQLSFLNLDSSYYPANNSVNNLSCEMPSTSINNFFEPYTPSYSLIDSYIPNTYVEPYNFSLDNYNSNKNYFDITSYQIPINSNFGLGNYNWGGGGYNFGGSYSKGPAKNNESQQKEFVFNEMVDVETSADDSFDILLGAPKANMANILDRECLNGVQDTEIKDPLRDFFELAAL